MQATEIKSSAANILGILRRKPDSTMRYARPDPWPADPAAISATIAPISASPPLMRSPARKYGSAEGSLSSVNCWTLVERYISNRSTRLRSADDNPNVVLASKGKNATRKAQTRTATDGLK